MTAASRCAERLCERLPATLRRLRNRRRGRQAERRAERYLARRGLRTLTRNYAQRTGEIDLVMLDGDTLVFVEVRYRGTGAWSSGLDSVDRRKQQCLARTAKRYLDSHPEHRFRVARFDVVAASRGKYGIVCEWTPDAFDATDG